MNLNGVGPAVSATLNVSTSNGGPQVNESNDASQSVVSLDQGAANQESVSQEHAKKLVSRANDLLADTRADMRLEYTMEHNQGIVNLVDTKTGQAIREIPASAFVQLVHQQFVGLLMDSRA